MSNPEPVSIPKKKHGCFYYGCITLIVLFLGVVVAVFFAVRFGLHKLNDVVAEYTQTVPMPIEKVQMSSEDRAKLKARIDAFNIAMNLHSNTPPLVLTGADINALLASIPDLQPFKDHVFISLDGDQIKAQVSLPLDSFTNRPPLNAPGMSMIEVKGRYLNGSATAKSYIANGSLFVYVQSLDVQGKPLPEKFLAGISQQNLAEGFNQGTNTSPFRQYESIRVTNSTLIVTPKPN